MSEGWKPISSAPTNRKIRVAAYIVPSKYAQQNGSKPFWDVAESSLVYGTPENGRWFSVLGGKPSLWCELHEPIPELPKGE